MGLNRKAAQDQLLFYEQQARSLLLRIPWASDRVLDAENALAAERQSPQHRIEKKDEQWKEFHMNQLNFFSQIGTRYLEKLADPALLDERENEERIFAE